MGSGTSIALVVVAVAFVAFLIAKLGLLGGRNRLAPEVRARVRERLVAARRDKTAASYVAAAEVLLREASQPARAAAFAARALRVEPTMVRAVELLREAWLAAGRPRRLARALWGILGRSTADEHTPVWEASWRILVELYEGPLRSAAKVEALRRMRAERAAPSDAS